MNETQNGRDQLPTDLLQLCWEPWTYLSRDARLITEVSIDLEALSIYDLIKESAVLAKKDQMN
jgi:hypothetical protein